LNIIKNSIDFNKNLFHRPIASKYGSVEKGTENNFGGQKKVFKIKSSVIIPPFEVKDFRLILRV